MADKLAGSSKESIRPGPAYKTRKTSIIFKIQLTLNTQKLIEVYSQGMMNVWSDMTQNIVND